MLIPWTIDTICPLLEQGEEVVLATVVSKSGSAPCLAGSKMIPANHALRSCMALKLWSVERKSHIMALVADEGLALFAGLNAIPKKSYLSEYASRISHEQTEGFVADVSAESVGPSYVRLRRCAVFVDVHRG